MRNHPNPPAKPNPNPPFQLPPGIGGNGAIALGKRRRRTGLFPSIASMSNLPHRTSSRASWIKSANKPLYLLVIVAVSWLSYSNIKQIFLLGAAAGPEGHGDGRHGQHGDLDLDSDLLDQSHFDLPGVAPGVGVGGPTQQLQLAAKSKNTTTRISHDVNDKMKTNVKTNTKNSSHVPQNLHIFWLTDASDQRPDARSRQQRQRMETAFRTQRLHPHSKSEPQTNTGTVQNQGIVTQIPWWTPEQVRDIYLPLTPDTHKRLLLTNNVTLKMKVEKPKRPSEYSYEEAARLVTHLTALVEAYKAGYDQVLILQDDAILTQAFFDHWHETASWAPKDWTVLQWATTNLATIEQSWNLPEKWISWLPDLWGTHAYTINRKGLQAIRRWLARERTVKPGTNEIFYTVDDQFDQILLADELLFSVPDQHAYTSTFPWIVSDEIRESIGMDMMPLPDLERIPTRNESLLVFMNIRFATSKRMGLEMQRTLSDIESVCEIHRYTKCHWVIQGVFTDEYLYTQFKESYEPNLPSNIIQFVTALGTERFNKFGLLKNHLSQMGQYDIVLVKDNDQRLTGFPWGSFLEQKGNALVAGPLRQAPDESYVRTKIWEKSQHYKLHDAQGWKKRNFAPWATSLFVNASAIEVPFLEMYFNTFDGNFAEWFFSQILTANFTEQDSCWGPDFLWCPAAKEYAASTMGQDDRMGCALVPFVSVHEDTRQITKDGEAFNERGYAAVENLRRSNRAFDRWYRVAFKYARGVIAWRQLDGIALHCRTKLLKGVYKKTDNIDFAKCRDAGLARKTIV